ncbi:MAG: protein translocase subunit SecF [Xanthomonadales bacterium]|nr:protein translocase subunit SecF [Gammaproteobacteria bacterium]NNK05570.1 protein translocase subunit SecF [Xanthomonadales bacterium]NNK98207.1 protein translocase subunit SecF [Xanthomonadales bacterium]
MKFLNRKTNIDFMSQRKVALVFSLILIVVSITSLATRGLNFGLDFTGGTLIEVGYPSAPDTTEVREQLAGAGFDSVVQTFGAATDIVVFIPPSEVAESNAELSTRVLSTLSQGVEGEIEVRRVEFVGPQVGDELAEQGILAVIYAMVGVFLYVMFRFQWRFSVGAVAALFHDIIISMGVISLVQVEFDLTVVAALLAVVGYSLNDTIVLFDRIRENFPRYRKRQPVEVVNTSINETLSRTLMTSTTTLIVLVSLFLFGGEIINGFAFTLIVGVLIGTYSSIYVASTTLLLMGVSKYDLMEVEKEGASLEVRP